MSSAFNIDQSGNPEVRRNELFPAYEDLRDPRFVAMRTRFGIDQAVAGIEDEFARILALRHWIAGRIGIENENPTPTLHRHAVAILEAAERGGRFHCAHFTVVQDAVLNAYGHVSRRLGIGPGTQADGRHHGVNEVWVNALCKWVVVDAKYDLHYELDGMPLSALEIRDQVLRDGGAGVRMVYGPERREGPRRGGEDASFYRWLSWEPGTAAFSSLPACTPSSLVVLDDEAFRAGTWIRDGRPHWAYDAGFFIRTVHRSWIEWTPNVLSCDLSLEDGMLLVRIESCTPNLATYQISVDGTAWAACHALFHLRLPSEGLAVWLRSLNLAGVAGPCFALRVRPAPSGAGARP